MKTNGMRFFLTVSLLLSGCQDTIYKTYEDLMGPVRGVGLKKSTSIISGESELFHAVIVPPDTDNKNVKWQSSDSSVVAIDSSGLAMAVAKVSHGETKDAIITVTTEEGGFSADCRVTVVEKPVPVASLTMNKCFSSILIGNNEQLSADIYPLNATNQNITWTSSASDIASVDASGLVTAKQQGTAVITVTAASGVNTSCAIKVSNQPVAVQGISLNKNTTIVQTDGTERIFASVFPVDATNQNLIWSSSAENIATVDVFGNVRGISAGDAVITVKSSDGSFISSCLFTVTGTPVAVTGVYLNKSVATVTTGYSEQLSAVLQPSNATNRNLSWKSSSSSVAVVDSSGLVTGISAGTAVVSVTTADGSKSYSCIFNIVDQLVPVSVISMIKTSLILEKGGSEQLKVSIIPDNASNKSLVWSSSNSAVASVDGKGIVTAVTGGTAVITAVTADGTQTASCNVIVEVPLEDITFNKTSLGIQLGGSSSLSVVFTPVDATNKSITWVSSDTSVADVDYSGNIIAKSEGMTLIAAVSADGGRIASCLVTVGILVTGFSITESCSIYMDQTFQITPVITPSNATNKKMTWTSSNTSIATVNDSGLVTPVSQGAVTITAKTLDGDFTDTCQVQVKVRVMGLELTPSTLSLFKGGTQMLTDTVIPVNADNQNVTWSSSNTSVATVNEYGLITAVADGTARITATTAEGGYSKYCDVTVTTPVAGVTVNPVSGTVYLGGSIDVTATVSPLDATNKTVTWLSSNTSIATVNSSGHVTPVARGTVTISATTSDGGFSAGCTLQVKKYVTGVSVTLSKTLLYSGETSSGSVIVTPSDADDKTVTWDSSDPGIASVNPQTGVVTPVSKGTASITATANDGSGKNDTSSIQVGVLVTGLTLDETDISLIAGQSKQLAVTVEPSDATNQNVTWTSDNPGIAFVTTNGLVTPVSSGTTTITVKSDQNNSVTAVCTVRVCEAEIGASHTGSTDTSYFTSVSVHPNGNVYTAGLINNSIAFNFSGITARGYHSTYNPVIVKYASGDHVFIGKYATSIYTTTVASNSSYFNSVAVCPDATENVYAVGYLTNFTTDTYNSSGTVSAMGRYNASPGTTVLIVKYNSSLVAQSALSLVQTAPDSSYYYSVAVDSSENIYAAGYVTGNSGTFSFGNSQDLTSPPARYISKNILLVKYNSSLNAQWIKSIESNTNQSEFEAVAANSSAVYAAGYMNGAGEFTFDVANNKKAQANGTSTNGVLVKYTPSGLVDWVRTVSTSPTTGRSHWVAAALDSVGNVYIAGYLAGIATYTFSTGVSVQANNAFYYPVIVKYNASGVALWAKTCDVCPAESQFVSIAADSSGNVYAAGYITNNGSYTFGTNVSVVGNYPSGKNIVLVKYRGTDGKALWARSVTAGPGISYFNGVAVDDSDYIYGVGGITGSSGYNFGDDTANISGSSTGANTVIEKYTQLP